MKISYNWLRTYLPVDLTPERMGEILTQTGLEVEGIARAEAVPGGLKGLVIGEVVEKGQHPNADRLSVTRVDVGGEEPLHIVCGAPNVAQGQKVVVATVGCMLYPTGGEPFKIKKGKIRGEVSEGMICAEDEIGLGTGHDGIMVLDPTAEAGTPAATYFELEDDFTIEIGLTPNRTDGMSHIGVARDLRAGLRHMADVEESCEGEVQWPDVSGFAAGTGGPDIQVDIANTERCPRYAGVTLSGVQVGPSPDWLQERLRSIGLVPINNVVDITNFVLHETGQPLHAFDADQIKGGKVIIDTLPEGTPFTTLDEVERKLSAEDLMICDGERNPLCLAGVFGGLHSGVTEKTTTVFLESAYFNPVSVRKSAKRHTLSTDASFRFERGVDPNMTDYVLKRAALLIAEEAGGTICSPVHDHYPVPIGGSEVEVKWDHITRLVGMEIPRETVKAILLDLNFTFTLEDDVGCTLSVPTYRVDVTREADVIEEVLRIYGFNNVPFPEKLNASLSYSRKPNAEQVQNRISDALVARGFTEIMSNSLTKGAYAEGIGAEELVTDTQVRILNPLSGDLNVLRQSMVFDGLEAIARNQNFRNPDLRLFEFGKVYFKTENGYDEKRRLALFVTGRRNPESWNNAHDEVHFADVKAVVEYLLNRLGINKPSGLEPLQHPLWNEGLEIQIRRHAVVRMGPLSGQLQQQFGIKQPVYWAELDWDRVLEFLSMNRIQAQELPKFPAVRRDLSLLIQSGVTFDKLVSTARKVEKKLLKHVDLFDVYEGDKLPDGTKSYALSFILQDPDKTLTDKHIDKVMANIQRALESDCGAQLR